MIRSPGYPPLPKLNKPNDDDTFNSAADVKEYVASNGSAYVPVAVGPLAGYYSVQHHKVIDNHGVSYSPTGFECAGGKEVNRKWRVSIRVLLSDGSRGKTLGQWLEHHNLDHLVPSPHHKTTGTPRTKTTKSRPKPATKTPPGSGSASPVRSTRRRRPPSSREDDYVIVYGNDDGAGAGFDFNAALTPTGLPSSSHESPTKLRRHSIYQTDRSMSPSNLMFSFQGVKAPSAAGLPLVDDTEHTPVRTTTPIADHHSGGLGASSGGTTGTFLSRVFNLLAAEEIERKNNIDFINEARLQALEAGAPHVHPPAELVPRLTRLLSHASSGDFELDELDDDPLTAPFGGKSKSFGHMAGMGRRAGSKELTSEDEEDQDLKATALKIINEEDQRAAEEAALSQQQNMPWLAPSLSGGSLSPNGTPPASPHAVHQAQQAQQEVKTLAGLTLHSNSTCSLPPIISIHQMDQRHGDAGADGGDVFGIEALKGGGGGSGLTMLGPPAGAGAGYPTINTIPSGAVIHLTSVAGPAVPAPLYRNRQPLNSFGTGAATSSVGFRGSC